MKLGFIIGKEDDPVKNQNAKIYKNFPEKLIVNDIDTGEDSILVDSAIPWYISQKYPEIKVDIIKPTKRNLTVKRLSQNDVNFLTGFDLITGLHTDKKWALEKVFKDKRSNIWPSWKLQSFIYDKEKYLNFFAKKGVPVLPTIFVKKDPSIEKVMKLIRQIEKRNLTKFVIKPVMSAWSIGFQIYELENIKKNPEILIKYFKKHSKMYPKFMVQDIVPGFSTHWEIRMFWFNDGKKSWMEYAIGNKAAVASPTGEEVITANPPKKYLDEIYGYGKIISKNFPTTNGVKPAMLRMDFGCCHNGKYFLNEIENQACNHFTRKLKKNIVPVYADLYVKKAMEIMEKGKKRFSKKKTKVTNSKYDV